jgi:hypothetical protein
MADNQIIPLEPDYSYDFNVILEGLNVRISPRWNFTDNAWYIDLEIVDTGVIIKPLKLVGGKNLLEQYAVTELGKLFMIDTEGQFADPDFDNIGDRFKLIYILKENVDDFPI